MTQTQRKKTNKGLIRVNTRISEEQATYIKEQVKKSNGTLTEGEVTRQLLDEAINNRKK